MIHVVHVITRTNIGGVSQYVGQLIDASSGLGYGHIIIRGTPDLNEGDYFTTHPVRAHVIDVPWLQRDFNPLKDLMALLVVFCEIRRIKPTIVHTHMAKAGAIGRVAAWLSGAPVRIHTFHGHLLQGYFSRQTVVLISLFEKVLQRITTWSVTNGERIRKDLIAHGVLDEHSSSSITPAVRPFNTTEQSVARRSLGLMDHGITAGFVGRFAKVKRPDRFIECARALPEFNFVMFGDGPMSGDVHELAKPLSNLHLAGWSTDLSAMYSSLDLLVLTSDNEAAAVVLIEAAIAGLPVVAMDVGSVSEVVIHEETGMLVNTDSELVDAVQRVLEDPLLRERLGVQAREHALREFSVSKLVDQHVALYTQLVTRYRR